MEDLLYFFGEKKKDKLIGIRIVSSAKGDLKKKIYKDSKGRYYINNGRKKYLPKGTRLKTTIKKIKTKKTGPKKRKDYSRIKIKSPQTKTVKNKKDKVIGKRLSARHVYDNYGKKAIGKTFNILQKDGTYKVKILKLRVNGSPYFANKFGKAISFPLDLKIEGPNFDNLTGYKNSWPNYPYMIAPGGVQNPDKMQLFPKGVHFHKNSFGKKTMCFG